MKNQARSIPAATGSSRPHRRGVGAGLALAGVLLVSSGAMAVQGGGDLVDDARAALDKWVEIQRVISKEKRDWKVGKELLEDRIGVVQDEITATRKKIDDTKANIADADEKRAALLQENEDLKGAAATLEQTIGGLEARAKALLARLPDPIRERVKPLSQRFPDDPGATKLSLSERYQNVVGVLNEIDKFDRDVTVTSEVRTLGDGTSAEVTAVYVGIGQGYYVSADGKSAGVGSATADVWTWTPKDDAAPEIARVVAILKNEKPAAFVRVPVRIE